MIPEIELGQPGSRQPGGRQPGSRRGLPVAAAILLTVTFLGFVTFLVLAFQPFASAAGGCGGG